MTLSLKKHIQSKAFKWFGAITHLEDFAKSKNIRFDFVVSSPKNKGLLKAYGKALEVLNNINTEKLIVEEQDLEEYVADALNTVKPSFENF